MLRIKGKAVTYGEVWFDEDVPARPGVDILVCHRRPEPQPDVPHQPFLSIVNDLTVAEDAVAEPFINTCRYQVRRADTKDGLVAEFLAEPAARLDEFCEFFDEFARQKSIVLSDRAWLTEAITAGRLVLTSASSQGTVLVWHAYLLSGDTASLVHSASYYRDGNPEQRNLVGRANRWLHWRDMLGFRGRGIARYDWGGLFMDESTPDRAGINNFKKSFGGRLERRCDYTVPVSVLGRIYLPLRDAWRRWKSRPAQPAAAAATA